MVPVAPAREEIVPAGEPAVPAAWKSPRRSSTLPFHADLSPSPEALTDTASERATRFPWRGVALGQAAWLVVMTLLALERAGYFLMVWPRVSWRIVLIEATVGLLWALLLPLVVFVSLRRPLGRGRGAWAAHVATFGVVALVEAIVYVVVDGTFLHAIQWGPQASVDFFERVRNTVIGQFVTSVKFYGVVAGITHAWDYRQLYHERQLRSARLRTQLAQSQLQVLRSELNPHFLFNALHAVSTLMHRDVEAADTMLARIGDLLRTSLESRRAHEVPLREELEFLGRYVDIERTRFGDRLGVRIDAAPEALDGCVPPLLLQPLVENALRHGIAPRPGPGSIEVRAWRRGDALRVLVRDDGLGSAAANGRRDGIGLANTRRRLRRLYGRDQVFRAFASPAGGFRVFMRLPFHTEPLGAIGEP